MKVRVQLTRQKSISAGVLPRISFHARNWDIHCISKIRQLTTILARSDRASDTAPEVNAWILPIRAVKGLCLPHPIKYCEFR